MQPNDPKWRLMIKDALDMQDKNYSYGVYDFLSKVSSFRTYFYESNGILSDVLDHWEAFRTYDNEIVIISSLYDGGVDSIAIHPAFSYVVKDCLTTGSWLSPQQTLLILNTKVKDLDLKVKQYSNYLNLLEDKKHYD